MSSKSQNGAGTGYEQKVLPVENVKYGAGGMSHFMIQISCQYNISRVNAPRICIDDCCCCISLVLEVLGRCVSRSETVSQYVYQPNSTFVELPVCVRRCVAHVSGHRQHSE